MSVAVPVRADFPFFTTIQTRFSDNDTFGHLNNVLYNRFFEAVVVAFYRECTPVDFDTSPIHPYVVEMECLAFGLQCRGLPQKHRGPCRAPAATPPLRRPCSRSPWPAAQPSLPP